MQSEEVAVVGISTVVVLGLILALFNLGVTAGEQRARLPCGNPAAVQTALDGCIAARMKLPELPNRGGSADLFEVCQKWAVDVACVRASVPTEVKP